MLFIIKSLIIHYSLQRFI